MLIANEQTEATLYCCTLARPVFTPYAGRVKNTEGNSMKTYSRLTLAFLLLILIVPQVVVAVPPKNRPQVKYHSNGQKRYESHYKDGKRDGRWIGWRENGNKEYESYYNNGKPDGLWTRWYENDPKSGESHYKDGKQDGLATSWYENGQKSFEAHYKNGKRISEKKF